MIFFFFGAVFLGVCILFLIRGSDSDGKWETPPNWPSPFSSSPALQVGVEGLCMSCYQSCVFEFTSVWCLLLPLHDTRRGERDSLACCYLWKIMQCGVSATQSCEDEFMEGVGVGGGTPLPLTCRVCSYVIVNCQVKSNIRCG